ncbi:MAG: glycosyltransferase [Bacteroidales bacterium]|nr:glycosyltransferase [Bacteroidales bacterium]
MKISLIIPVYNAEKTLPATLESIASQTFRDFEVIFADDASTDGTPALLEEFCRQWGSACKLLRKEVNSGAAAARNMALDAAEGEYLTFADADDILAADMLQKASDAADASGADIVGWDWTLQMRRYGRYMRQADYSTPAEAVRALTGGRMRWNLWLFLVRRSLIEDNGISFVEGADMAEDMQFMLRSFLKAGTTYQIHESLYSYNGINDNSISKGFSEQKRRQTEINLALVEDAFSASSMAQDMPEAMLELKLFLKRPLLTGMNKSDYETWYGWFPESNALAAEGGQAPRHTRILQKMAARRFWPGVRIYSFLVNKLMYGIIFRLTA